MGTKFGNYLDGHNEMHMEK